MEQINLIQVTPQELSDLINEGLKKIIEERVINSKNPQDEFLSRKETARFFGISLVCLHEWTNKGYLRSYKMGNRTYYKRDEIIQSLTNSKTEAA